MLADRFGGGPLLYDQYPADYRERMLELLRVESQVAEMYVGLGPDDEVVFPPDYDDVSEG